MTVPGVELHSLGSSDAFVSNLNCQQDRFSTNTTIPKRSFLHNSGYGCVHFEDDPDEPNSIVVLARNGSVRASIRVEKCPKTTKSESTFSIKLSKKQTRESVRRGGKGTKTKSKIKADQVKKPAQKVNTNVEGSVGNVSNESVANPSVVAELKTVIAAEKPKTGKPTFSTRSGTRRSVRHGSFRRARADDPKIAKSESADRALTSNQRGTRVVPKNLPAVSERDEQKSDSGVYGSVKSLVKQAIRNFEKLDSVAKAEQTSFDQSRTKSMPTGQQCDHSRAQPTLSLPVDCRPQASSADVTQITTTTCVEVQSTPSAEVQDGMRPVLILAPPGTSESSDYEHWNAEKLYSNTEEATYANCGPLASAALDNEPSVRPNFKPNSSFLWSGKSKQIYQDIYLPLSENRPPDGYDEIGNVPAMTTDSSSGYDDVKSLPSLGYDDVKPLSVGYDDIKAPSISYDDLKQNYEEARMCTTYYNVSQAPSVRYDDIRPARRRASCLYDDLRPPSSNGYIEPSLVVNMGPSSVVTAVPAVISEDQSDSISYFYDDIGGAMRTYEKIGGGENAREITEKKDDEMWYQQDESDELFTYRLPKVSVIGAIPASPAPSLTCSRSGTERRSETSDEWMDVSDVETDEGVCTEQSPTQGSKFIRDRRARSTRRPSRVLPRKAGRSWTRAFRDFFKLAPSSKSPDYEVTRSVHRQPSTSSAASSYSTLFLREVTVSSCSRIYVGDIVPEPPPSSPDSVYGSIDYSSITYACEQVYAYSGVYSNVTLCKSVCEDGLEELQEINCWIEGESESEAIREESINHYETLYEVINNTLTSVPGHVSDDFEDSFESEDDVIRETSQDAISQKSRDSGNASSYGLSKITEAANKKMRHFRHHLTSRRMDFRSEISNTFSRIRKRSTVSTADLSDLFKRNPNGESDDVTMKTVSELNLCESRISGGDSPQSPPSGKKQGTWKLPNMKKKGKKDSLRSTFYLTLTVESDEKHDSGFFNKDDSDSLPSLGSCRSLAGNSPNSTTAKTPIAAKGRRPSSAYDVVRPRTAPPPPPSRQEGDGESPPPYPRTAPPPPPSRQDGDGESPPPYPPPPIPDAKMRTIGGVKVMDISASELMLRKRPTSESDLVKLIETELENRVSTLSSSYIKVRSSVTGHDPAYDSSEKSDHSYLSVQLNEDGKRSQFATEPLYQFYTASILDRAILDDEDSEEDDYEVIRPVEDVEPEMPEVDEKLSLPRKQSAMELLEPSGGTRTLWCQLPAVISSGVLNRLSIQARKKQEAMFEVITSEASYLRSLNVLVNQFMNCPDLSGDVGSVITKREWHLLFSDLIPVQTCSERFLADLEKRWQESVVIKDICDIILSHAENHFDVYVKYCSHQLYQERTLKELKESNPGFNDALRRLESDPVCQSLAMHSFLMLPMQRITRLPLLVDAIYHRMDFSCPDFETCKMALATLSKIVQECNEGARKMERYEEMLVLSSKLEFKDVKAVPLISSTRWLVKRGEFTRISFKEGVENKLTFGRKVHKSTVHLYLFTDLLLVVKKKGEDCIHVIDYCLRNMIQLTDFLEQEQVMGKGENGKDLMLLTMLQNHENKTTEMILSCNLESNRTRWLEALTPKTSDNPDEVIYEEWDCPQVQVIHPYAAKQNDELSLQVADVVNVLRKMADGWYEGERIRDRGRGWFPGNYTQEIASVHVRAKNLKQRYRLLALSGSFLARQQESDQTKRRSRVF